MMNISSDAQWNNMYYSGVDSLSFKDKEAYTFKFSGISIWPEVQMTYPSLIAGLPSITGLPSMNNIGDPASWSTYVRMPYKSLSIDMPSMNNIGDFVATDTKSTDKAVASATTDTKSMDAVMQNNIAVLDKEKERFIRLLIRSDFEDGFSNEAIDFAKQQVTRYGQFPVAIWFSNIYEDCTANKTYVENRGAVARLLFTVAYLHGDGLLSSDGRFPLAEGVFYAMTRASLFSKDEAEQEAALSVIEEWRSKPFLAILNEGIDGISNTMLSKYAHGIREEISEELCDGKEDF